MSNRDIAQALFVSTKTVETQLSQAYAKLGIASRAGLAQALAGAAERRTSGTWRQKIRVFPDALSAGLRHPQRR